MADLRRLHPQLTAVDMNTELFVPELSPVVDPVDQSGRPLMTRPWLDWARRVTMRLKAAAGGGQAPGPHAPTHEPGGNDPMHVDAAASVGSLRTLGNGPNQAAPGSRPPLAHAPTHHVGGGDTVTVTSLGGYPGGTSNFLRADGAFAPPSGGTPGAHHTTHEPGGADALVNAAWTNQANTFTQHQTLQTVNPRLLFYDTGGAANERRFDQFAAVGNLYFQPWLDDGSNAQATPLILQRNGDARVGANVYEKGRTTPMGHWMDVPFNPVSYGAQGATWTVTAGDVNLNHYTLIGKTCFWTLVVSGTVTPATSQLYVVIPGNLVGIRPYDGITRLALFFDGYGYLEARAYVLTNNTIVIERVPATQMAGGLVRVNLSMAFEVG